MSLNDFNAVALIRRQIGLYGLPLRLSDLRVVGVRRSSRRSSRGFTYRSGGFLGLHLVEIFQRDGLRLAAVRATLILAPEAIRLGA